MLDQVGDEAAEVVPLLGELLDEGQCPCGVAIDDEVAEAEERLLLDRAEQLQDRLHRHLAFGRRRELVECRGRVAERAARRARDQRERSEERRVGKSVDLGGRGTSKKKEGRRSARRDTSASRGQRSPSRRGLQSKRW